MCQPFAGKSRKQPAIAVNTSGDTLVVWADGAGRQRGGDLAGQVFDKSGEATDQHGRALRGIPVWGLPTAWLRPKASSSSTDTQGGLRDGPEAPTVPAA